MPADGFQTKQPCAGVLSSHKRFHGEICRPRNLIVSTSPKTRIIFFCVSAAWKDCFSVWKKIEEIVRDKKNVHCSRIQMWRSRVVRRNRKSIVSRDGTSSTFGRAVTRQGFSAGHDGRENEPKAAVLRRMAGSSLFSSGEGIGCFPQMDGDGDISCSPVGPLMGKYLILPNVYVGPGKQQCYVLFGAGKILFSSCFLLTRSFIDVATGTEVYITYRTIQKRPNNLMSKPASVSNETAFLRCKHFLADFDWLRRNFKHCIYRWPDNNIWQYIVFSTHKFKCYYLSTQIWVTNWHSFIKWRTVRISVRAEQATVPTNRTIRHIWKLRQVPYSKYIFGYGVLNVQCRHTRRRNSNILVGGSGAAEELTMNIFLLYGKTT